MKKVLWRKWGLWAVGGLLAVLVWMVWPSREIAYNGRSLSEWLDAAQSTNAMERVVAAAAIRAIGTNAEPVLLDWLKRRDLPGARYLSGLLAKLGAPPWERSSERYYRSKAVLGFQVLGPRAHGSIRILQDLLANAATRNDAAIAISAVAPDLLWPIMTQWRSSTNAALSEEAWRINADILDWENIRRAWDVP